MDNRKLVETIRSEILTIRGTGATNMFDVHTVRKIAEELNYVELVKYIDTNKDGYFDSIFTGEINL